MTHSTKRLLAGIAVLSTSALLFTGCAGFGGGGKNDPSSAGGELTFTTWASESEQAAFQKLIDQFQSEHAGTKITLNVVPYDQMFSNIDAQLSSGDAPDIFRVDYGNLGVYSSQGQLLDLSPYVSQEEADAFVPAMWEAVSYDGKPYGVPHQTDVSALLVNTDMLKAAGIDPSTLPKTQADAWSWDQFADVAAKLRAQLPADKYPFVYNWQLGGAPRWLSWLFQADGSLIGSDGTTPEIDSDAGAKALDFTKSFFAKQWVPPASSTKSTTYADSFFSEGSVAMAFIGSFLVPDMDSLNKFNWTSVPMPKDERAATDLGGNALVATKDTKNPELAAEFLKFMSSKDSMTAFCAATNELPTRTDISGSDIPFAIRPDVMPVFVEQATTIQPSDVKQLTSPAMAAISTALQDQLEAAFLNGQSTSDTLKNLSTAVADATKK